MGIAKINNKPVVGKYILDTLSTGMYNDPLIVIREYIQNSVDSVDEAISIGIMDESSSKITIEFDWKDKSMTINDNGAGIPLNKAYEILTNLGNSTKKMEQHRGFRGIGRLGGLSYCDQLTFTTKARGEAKYSQSTWNCIKLRALISDKAEDIDVIELLNEVVAYSQHNYEGDNADHFFSVKMDGIKSGKNVLLDIPLIKSYLAQVAPVPFNSERFSFAHQVETHLKKHVTKYETYNIQVNGERIYKPYTDAVNISDKRRELIQGIKFISFSSSDGNLAYGWMAKLDFHGVVSRSSLMDGLRVRSGNIMIGNKRIFADYYRETRFNNYLIGEIHTVDHGLVPNSRRDDFEDNKHKEDLISCFVRQIGLPYSLKIREASVKRSQSQRRIRENDLIEKAKHVIRNGYYSESQKTDLINRLSILNGTSTSTEKQIAKGLVIDLKNARHYLDVQRHVITPLKKNTYKNICEIIFSSCQNKNEAETIINRLFVISPEK